MYCPKGNSSLYYNILHQKRVAEILLSALRFDLFSYLENWETPEAVAEKSGLHTRSLAQVLNALVSLGFIEKKQNTYRNTPQSNEFLNRNSFVYLGESLIFREKMMSLKDIDERLQMGPIAEVIRNNSGVEVYDFYEAARISIPEMYTGRVQAFIAAATSIYNDKPPKNILDLGGGSGVLAIELIRAFPGCQGTIFEHPSVAGLPRELVIKEGVSEHITVLEGDFNRDDFGDSYDLIIAAGILDFAKDHFEYLMNKLYNALNPDGLLYLVTHQIREDYLSPPERILGWLSSHLDGLDLLLTEKNISEALRSHGFKKIQAGTVGGTFASLRGMFFSK
ncbi:Dimerisation domain-containing protein [Anaerovirgula multivorans]|uniref:Dimerisation domain-containing protein n=1 Tax=Anaerovirgula multivorans TaxID=312168 RepID=A0A239G8M6_9FIRM|nr:methyltransferase [Anaerovirgula multivorans]SNS65295.1 Dimerisation domain-containing protein [Anaerovirgula multivorans]